MLATAIVGLALLDWFGLLSPPPPAAAVREKVRRKWASVQGYETVVLLGGEVVAGPMGHGVVRWERDGRVGVGGQEIGGFFHREIIQGDRREYYQPGAEIVGSFRLRGLRKLPYASWKLSGYPGLHDLVQILLEAPEARTVGRSSAAGEECDTVRVLPREPEAARLSEGTDAEFYRVRFTVPWLLSVGRRSGLPLRGEVGGTSGSRGWDIQFSNLRMNPRWTEADWTFPEQARRMQFVCDLSRPQTVAAAEAQLKREVDRWKMGVMYSDRPR